jgi:hypothetical protein
VVDVRANTYGSVEPIANPAVIDSGVPSLFQGGAAFPGNDWTASPGGEEYLSRIPAAAHRALGKLRDFTLRVTKQVVRRIEQGRHDVVEFSCH